MTNAEARFNNSLRPRKPEGSLGRTAQDGHLHSHTAPELWPKERPLYFTYNRVYCVSPGPWPHNLFLSCPFSFFDWVGVLWPQLSKVLKPVRWAGSVLCVPALSSRSSVSSSCCLYASDSGESLHRFPAGVIKSYVIATSDLWLFIHASSSLPSPPHPAPIHMQSTKCSRDYNDFMLRPVGRQFPTVSK